MSSQIIYVVNKSTLVSTADALAMTHAVDHQMSRDVEPVWNLPRTPVVFTAVPPRGSRVIVLVDTADDPQALGYHDDDGGLPQGIVGCKPELDQGAKALSGAYSVSTILSHEVLELAVDARCNLWADSGHGYLVAYEVGDPTQSDWYMIDGVAVSNFVHPAYFDPNAPHGTKLDQMGLIAKPFTLRKGGYWVSMSEGRVGQKFGDEVPAWLISSKMHNPISRTRQRSGQPAEG